MYEEGVVVWLRRRLTKDLWSRRSSQGVDPRMQRLLARSVRGSPLEILSLHQRVEQGLRRFRSGVHRPNRLCPRKLLPRYKMLSPSSCADSDRDAWAPRVSTPAGVPSDSTRPPPATRNFGSPSPPHHHSMRRELSVLMWGRDIRARVDKDIHILVLNGEGTNTAHHCFANGAIPDLQQATGDRTHLLGT